ncbi:hypothetical protein HN511_04020 [bacterium]|nr:hypothetical protein [bacterium]
MSFFLKNATFFVQLYLFFLIIFLLNRGNKLRNFLLVILLVFPIFLHGADDTRPPLPCFAFIVEGNGDRIRGVEVVRYPQVVDSYPGTSRFCCDDGRILVVTEDEIIRLPE